MIDSTVFDITALILLFVGGGFSAFAFPHFDKGMEDAGVVDLSVGLENRNSLSGFFYKKGYNKVIRIQEAEKAKEMRRKLILWGENPE